MSTPTTQREIERKFRVHALFEWPELSSLNGLVQQHPVVSMRAVYHDTSELTLFRWKVTLRRREGGLDAGWHLKLPVEAQGAGVRDELHVALNAGEVGQVPAELADIITPLVRDLPLVPVVELRTERSPRIVSNLDGKPLVEAVDDVVTVIDQHGNAVAIFRELEIELLDNDDPEAQAMLEELSSMLISAGAVPGTMSKAASALGPRASAPADVPELPMPGPSGMAVDAIRATIATHVRALIFADIAVRRNMPDSVHQVRVAARRLRSNLRTFDPLLDHEWVVGLEDELAWLANEMGMIRDSEVLEERLLDHAQDLQPEDSQKAIEAIRTALDRRIQTARAGAMAALRSDRHTYLIEDLIEAARAPRILDVAYQPCELVFPPLIQRAWKVLSKSCGLLRIQGPAPDWHRARIKAKRARYAVDVVVPIFGTQAKKFAKTLGDVTELLGEHQDAYVAQEFLKELSTSPDVNGSTGFALGLLHGVELDYEMQDRYTFADTWDKARKSAQQSGLV